MIEKQNFLPSVAKVTAYDPTTDAVLWTAHTLSNSMLELAMDEAEIRGGYGNPVVFNYYFGRTVTFDLTAVNFKYEFLADNVGSTITSGTVAIQKQECVTLDGSGVGTLVNAPTSGTKVYLYNESTGGSVEVTPSGSTVTHLAWASTTVEALYFTDKTADSVTIGAGTTPKVLHLVIMATQFNNAGINGYLQVDIPRAQVSGNFSLEFTSDGVSTTQLTGKALVEGSSCGTPIYGTVSLESVSSSATGVSSINPYFVANDSDYMEVDIPTGSPATYQITVDGYRSGEYGKVDVTTDCTFTATGDADITVGEHTGLVSVATTASTLDTSTIKVEYTGAGDMYVTIKVVDV